jgi:hypothetical protein
VLIEYQQCAPVVGKHVLGVVHCFNVIANCCVWNLDFPLFVAVSNEVTTGCERFHVNLHYQLLIILSMQTKLTKGSYYY